MSNHVLRFTRFLKGFVLAAMISGPALAAYPDRAITLVVPFPPGGSTDVVARIIANKASTILGQKMIVENRPGGSSTIGLDIAAKAQPDGHTIGIANVTFCANPSLIRKMPFDSEIDIFYRYIFK